MRLFLLFLFCFGLFFVFFQSTVAEEEILLRSNPKKYHVRISLEFKSVDVKPESLVVAMPLPETNEYQTIRRLETSSGEILAYPETGEKYLSCRFFGAECPLPGAPVTIFHEFEATLYDLTVDFSKINEIYPYEKDSALYRRYTGKSGVFVDPDHPEIKRIAERIAVESKDPLDFARKAYLYVSDHYKYLNPNTGLAPLEKLLQNGGGDCGNLSSIFISLLRNQGIPARHLVAVRPDASWHVWADFYLEKYGWIPVDVTYRLEDKTKTGDYFGRVRIKDNGIILSREVDLSVVNGKGEPQKVGLMQVFAHWCSYGAEPRGRIEHNYSLVSQFIE